MHAIAQGLSTASAIEGFLKTGRMNHFEPPATETKLTYSAIKIIPSEAVRPENGKEYSREEARAEANRCLKCTCDACVRNSPLLGYFRKFPKKITEEVEVSINPSSLDGEATPGNTPYLNMQLLRPLQGGMPERDRYRRVPAEKSLYYAGKGKNAMGIP
ncbi:MAG: hypothetical protein IPI69_15925 [Bacteroidales bacterium]|nr:hypothetical protein [Bacteroidales bacterium]